MTHFLHDPIRTEPKSLFSGPAKLDGDGDLDGVVRQAERDGLAPVVPTRAAVRRCRRSAARESNRFQRILGRH